MKIKRLFALAAVVLIILCLCACAANKADTAGTSDNTDASVSQTGEQTSEAAEPDEQKELHMRINDTEVLVKWETNESVDALAALAQSAPLTIKMSGYGGFEQVGSLGAELPRNDTRVTAQPGDIMLYSGNQISVFYGSNTWEYTRLGQITGSTVTDLATMLAGDDVTVTISAEG